MSSIKISAELSHRCPLAEIDRQARILDDSGFHRVWVPDTAVSPWEAWLAASLIVQNTTQLKIGLGVTNPYTRHPVVMAQMAGTLQSLSKGRLSLSLGKGLARFLERAGIEQHDQAVEECLTIIRHLTNGERFSFKGKVFRIEALRLRTEPPGEKIPAYLAAVGPASWKKAAQIADGLSTFWDKTTPEKWNLYLKGKEIPVAVLIPFSASLPDFFPNSIQSLKQLTERVAELEAAAFVDEIILAYGDSRDLNLITERFGEGKRKEQL